MKNSDFSIEHMMIAIECAKKAYSKDEVPVGAVIVRDGKIIGKGWNTILENQSVFPRYIANNILIDEIILHSIGFNISSILLKFCSREVTP